MEPLNGSPSGNACTRPPRRHAAPPQSHLRAFARNAFPFLVLGGVWEIVAHLGLFPAKLFPPIETIAAAFYRLTVSGILPLQVAETLLRLAAGFALAAVIGVDAWHSDGPLAPRRGHRRCRS